MSVWEEAAVEEAIAAAMTLKGDARSVLIALAPHFAARDAAVWVQACEAMRLAMLLDFEKDYVPLDADDIGTVEAPPQPQSEGTKP